jgi:hypothetical protein
MAGDQSLVPRVVDKYGETSVRQNQICFGVHPSAAQCACVSVVDSFDLIYDLWRKRQGRPQKLSRARRMNGNESMPNPYAIATTPNDQHSDRLRDRLAAVGKPHLKEE